MDSTLIGILINTGVAGVIVVCFICGLIVPKGVADDLRAENRDLKAALKAERDRNDAGVAAASATRDILAAIQFGQRTGPPGDA